MFDKPPSLADVKKPGQKKAKKEPAHTVTVARARVPKKPALTPVDPTVTPDALAALKAFIDSDDDRAVAIKAAAAEFVSDPESPVFRVVTAESSCMDDAPDIDWPSSAAILPPVTDTKETTMADTNTPTPGFERFTLDPNRKAIMGVVYTSPKFKSASTKISKRAFTDRTPAPYIDVRLPDGVEWAAPSKGRQVKLTAEQKEANRQARAAEREKRKTASVDELYAIEVQREAQRAAAAARRLAKLNAKRQQAAQQPQPVGA